MKRSHDALSRNLGRLGCSDVLAIEHNLPSGGDEKLRQSVKHRGLARPIGPDQSMDMASLNLKVDTIDGNKALEFLDQVFGLEDDVFCHKGLQVRRMNSKASFCT